MKKFKIALTLPTTNKCIRFPNDIIDKVEKAIEGYNCIFTAFVVEAVRVALDNIEDEKKLNKQKPTKLKSCDYLTPD